MRPLFGNGQCAISKPFAVSKPFAAWQRQQAPVASVAQKRPSRTYTAGHTVATNHIYTESCHGAEASALEAGRSMCVQF